MKVLVPHSWSLNMGDAAMLVSIADMLKGIAPETEVTALVSHPGFTKDRCRIDVKLCAWPWPVRKTEFRDIAVYPAILISNFFSVMVFRLFKKRVFLSRLSRNLEGFFDCDLVLSPGGDFISPKYFYFTTFFEFLFARVLGKKLVIFPQTIGPFRGFLEEWIASLFLRLPHMILVREMESRRLLAGMGIESELTADLAFAFPELPPKKEIHNSIVICPKKISGNMREYRIFLKKLIGRIRKEFGSEIVFLASDFYDCGFQMEIASEIPGVRVVPGIGSPEEISRLISGSEFIISSRMHAIILGALSHTPFFSIGDSFKFDGVLGPLSANCSVKQNRLDDESIELIAERIRGREELRNGISTRFPQIRKAAQSNAGILSNRLRDWGFLKDRERN